MSKVMIGLVIAGMLLVAPQADAAFIKSVSGSDMATSYSAGVLTISDTVSIVVEYDNATQISYDDAVFVFTAALQADNSVPGIANGVFGNGSYSITDSSANLLLSGQVQSFELETLFSFLVGPGFVTLDSGALLSDLQPGYTQGETTSVLYNLKISPVSDFSGNFTGSTNMTIQPIPEPATMVLLGLGSLALIRRKNA